MPKFSRQSGFSLVEVALAGALFVIFSAAVVGSLLQTLSNNQKNAQYITAVAYAREGLEMVRAKRKDGFAGIGTVSGGGIVPTGTGKFRFDDTSNTTEGFERVMTVEPAKRHEGHIVDGSGDEDERTLKVVSKVYWESSAGNTETLTLTEYLTYWDEPY